jgi:hypothetical protein
MRNDTIFRIVEERALNVGFNVFSYKINDRILSTMGFKVRSYR